MSNLYEKLQQSRVTLQKKKLKKSGKNSYSGFEYFELGDFLPIVNEIFLEHKLCSNFGIKDNEATLKIINAENPEENICFTMPTAELQLKGCSAIQALGGVNTYCKRYLYLNALEIVECDMLDAKAGAKDFTPVTPAKGATPEDADIYIALAKIEDTQTLKSYYNLNKDKVNDKKALYEMVQRRLEAIKQIQLEFGEDK